MKKFKTVEQNYQLDDILEKINNDGLSSLNYNEKKYLHQCRKNKIDIRLEKILYENEEGVFISDDDTFELLKYEHKTTGYKGKSKYLDHIIDDEELIIHDGLLYINTEVYDCNLVCYDDGELKNYRIDKCFEYDVDEEDDDILNFDDLYSEDEIKNLYNIEHGNLKHDFKGNLHKIEGFLRSIVCPNLS